MGANVGGVSCDFVRHRPGVRGQQKRVQIWEVPGYDGFGALIMGKSGALFAFTVIKFGTGAQVQTWIDAVEAKKGSLVTIEDDWGTEHTGCLIRRMGTPAKEAAHIPGSAIEAWGQMVIEGVKM